MNVPYEFGLSFAGIAFALYLAERLGYHPKWCSQIIVRQVVSITVFCLGVILPVTLICVYAGSGWPVLLAIPFSLILRITFLWREAEFKKYMSDQEFLFNRQENEDKKTFNFRCYR